MATLEEWRKFLANETESQREYRTIEIFHPQLSQVYRFVSNSVDVSLTLESDAPRNPGETVVFEQASLGIVEPAEREDSEQTLGVKFGTVDGRLPAIVDQITGTGFFTPVQIVYRKYFSGDLTQPAVPPLLLSAANLDFDGPTSVELTAEDADLSQKRSGRLYRLEVFAGLAE